MCDMNITSGAVLQQQRTGQATEKHLTAGGKRRTQGYGMEQQVCQEKHMLGRAIKKWDTSTTKSISCTALFKWTNEKEQFGHSFVALPHVQYLDEGLSSPSNMHERSWRRHPVPDAPHSVAEQRHQIIRDNHQGQGKK